MRYKLFCTIKRTKFALAMVWALAFVAGIVIHTYNSSVYGKTWIWTNSELRDIFVLNVHIVIQSIYIVFAVICYVTMFCIYVNSTRRSRVSSQLTTFGIFRRSKFYVALLLITSYLLFTVIPYLILATSWRYLSTPVWRLLETLIPASDTVDFFIYLFLYRPVYKILRQCLPCYKRSEVTERNDLVVVRTTAL